MAKAEKGSEEKATKKAARSRTSTKKKQASAKKQASDKRASSKSKGATSEPASSTPTAQSVPDNVQLPATRGKVSIFGGPKDRGFKPDDKLGLPTGPHFAYERIRTLNPKSFYCSMRWDYDAQ